MATTEVTETEESSEGSERGIKETREFGERQKARADKAEAKLEATAFADLKLDPEKGIGKALRMTYDGLIEPDNLEAVRAVLESDFGYTVPADSAPPPKSANTDVSEGEREMKDITDQSKPAPNNAAEDKFQEYVESGDTQGAFEQGLAMQGVKFHND